MPPTIVASSIWTHAGSEAARRASSATANGTPPEMAAICSTSSWSGSVT